ncbi:CD206 [Mytilus edulis]|uniref:MRC n=1 Tax=Mytilus edulis TaxID=6550 RepID=A0A8S3QHX2_MYTED|nr:CD206 [Mytilus edulis]
MFATEKETWTNAEFRCRVFGGHLAEIEDADTNKFLKDTAQMKNANDHNHHYFIGLTDEAALDEWEWVQSATKPNFTNWGNHQPDHNGNDEHCVLFYARDHYRWHDADCDDHNYFICEEEEVNSGGILLDEGCRHGWMHFRDRCYMFSTEEESWTNAEFRCRVFGGHLAEIQDAETNRFLQDNARLRHANDNNYNYFIGLTDEAALDEWEWVQSATKPNFTNWGDNQPDHQGNDEHCVFLYANDHYRWHDVDCDDHDLFICEEEEMNTGGNIIG